MNEYTIDTNMVKITVGCREYLNEIKCYDQTGQEVVIEVTKKVGAAVPEVKTKETCSVSQRVMKKCSIPSDKPEETGASSLRATLAMAAAVIYLSS